MKRLPEYYERVEEFRELEKNLFINSNETDEKVGNLKNELFVITAKKDGIDVWSKLFEKNVDKDYILTRLKTNATITKLNLAQMITALLKQDVAVEITEFFNEYRVNIGLYNSDIPLEKVYSKIHSYIRDLIPSHLNFTVYFNSLVWENYDYYNKNWKEWDELNLSWLEFEKYHESII